MWRCIAFALLAAAAAGCRAKEPAGPPENPEACDLSLFEANATGGCDWTRLHAETGERTTVTTVASSCGALSIAWGPDRRRALLGRALPTPAQTPTPTPNATSRVRPTPAATPVYEVDEVDFTTGERTPLGSPPDGSIVEFGWDPGAQPAVISSVPLTASPVLWAKVRSLSGAKALPDCDPGGVYYFSKPGDRGWILVKSVLGDCSGPTHAHPGQLGIGLSGLLTGYRTPYRNAKRAESRAIGTSGGGIVFESAYGDVIAAGTAGEIRTPLAFLDGARPLAVDLPDSLALRGGVRERCLLLADRTDGGRPRLFDLRENRLRFESDTAIGASFWPIAEPTPAPSPSR